ncbi:SRPBCC family protein [Streptomyces sp. NBC_01210]|uniref:SRPBCC family protein n=1 Tax=Streptomyces sp. NBC_01210 TaxID=2903774 RepID=UPI002E164E59|nr:SRPBCC family protein [Streptomyces sp. NBC_01210]
MAEKPSLLSADNPAAQKLKEELLSYLAVQAQQKMTSVGRTLGRTTVKLNDIAEGRSPGLAKLAVEGGRKAAQGKGPLRSAVELGASRIKGNITQTLKGFGGKRKKARGGSKPVVIMESVDVGVPVREAYDQWSLFQDFSTFTKGVKSVSIADDATSDWQLKIFWSSRSWQAHVTEQIPDTRIQWTSQGAKGRVNGVVTFHPLGENLTRVLLVLEYYPKGLFERTGNLWRAQGRRARLDLKNFARHISMRGEAEDGWRGEIRDGEVVRRDDDAAADEQDERDERDEQIVYEDDDAEEEPEDEYEYEADDDEDENEYEDQGLDEDEAEVEDEAEYAGTGNRGRR